MTPKKIRIAPSLLAADFSRLGSEIEAAEAAGADLLHVDVMDGHFVPNITIGPFIVEAIKRVATLPLDVHLMISDPEKYLQPFIDAGSDSINFHLEVVDDVQRLIDKLHKAGVKAGIVVNPETPVEQMYDWLDRVDQVMIMTVNPGFGGQKLIPECVEKIRQIAMRAEQLDIEVDGGINNETVGTAAEAGANVIIAGTAVFGFDDRAKAIATLRRNAEHAAAARGHVHH